MSELQAILAKQRAKVGEKGSTNSASAACDDFRADVTAEAFGMCKCGFHKSEHTSTVKRNSIRRMEPNNPSSNATTSVNEEEKKGGACNNYAVDVTAAKFGTCKCGFHKSEHSRDAQLGRSKPGHVPVSKPSLSSTASSSSSQVSKPVQSSQVPKPSHSTQVSEPNQSSVKQNTIETPLPIKTSGVQDVKEERVKALYDFASTRDGDLQLNAGDVIVVVEKPHDGWWRGKNARGEEGLFPANYVQETTEPLHPKAQEPPPQQQSSQVPKQQQDEETSSISKLKEKFAANGRVPSPTRSRRGTIEPKETQVVLTTGKDVKPVPVDKVRAIYDFDAPESGDLRFRAGEIISITSKINDDWWEGKKEDGSTGIFPTNMVEKLVLETPSTMEPPSSSQPNTEEPTSKNLSVAERKALLSKQKSGFHLGSPTRSTAKEPQAHQPSPPTPPAQSSSSERIARAKFTFDGEEQDDLAFDEGDEIRIVEQVDDNWLRGQVVRGTRAGSKVGIFPANFVEDFKPSVAQPPPPSLPVHTPMIAQPPPPSPPAVSSAAPPPPPPAVSSAAPPPPPPAVSSAAPPPPPPQRKESLRRMIVPELKPGFSKGEISRPPSLQAQEPPPPWYSKGDTYSLQSMTQRGGLLSSGGGNLKTDTYEILKQDRTKVKLEIQQNMESQTAYYQVTVEPFVPPPKQVLELSAQKFGPLIVQFAEGELGRRVGDGECWTLADRALRTARTAPAVGKNFGAKVDFVDVLPGDVIQMGRCKFRTSNGFQTVDRQHTAVVHSRLGPKRFKVLEQNPKPVSYGEYDFDNMLEGTFDIFRPLPPDGFKIEDLIVKQQPPPPPPPGPQPAAPGNSLYRALYDFEPQEPTDLGFRAGETIQLESVEEGWGTGSIGTRRGMFPLNYVERI